MDAVKVYPNLTGLNSAAADTIAIRAMNAIAERGIFTLALAGGSTPQALYELLATDTEALEWSKVHLFFGDERCVPPDHPDSNFGMVKTALLDQIPIPATNVHRMRGELAPADAATEYAKELWNVFGDALPQLDMVLLGMGNDGHTASLFPATEALAEQEKWVIANHVPQLDTWRITLTYPILNNARLVLMLVSGAAKAELLAEVMHGEKKYPIQQIRPTQGDLWWFIDEDAAAKL